jgi:4-hydroxybenzoate polyprenyltransferase
MIEVTIAMMLLSFPPSPAPVIVGLITFAVYTNDRVADAEADAVSNPKQAAFARRHGDSLYTLAALAYGLAISLAVFGGPVALGITLLPGIFWILYGSHWVTSLNSRVQRLKNLLVINSAVVALAWATSLTFLPVAFADGSLTPAVGLVFGYFFLRSFVDVEIPNVRDIDADRAVGVMTIPTVFGIRRTRHALYGVDLLTAVLVGYGVLSDLIAWPLGVALCVGLCYSLGIISRIGRTVDEDFLGQAPNAEYVLVGGVMLLILAVS